MPEYADLEMNLQRRDGGGYTVEMRFSPAQSEADVRLVRREAHFDLAALRSLELNSQGYGAALGQQLFQDPVVRTTFQKALIHAETLDVPLRLRLAIDPDAKSLHALHWEALQDPQDGSTLTTKEHILFSRYLSSGDLRPVRLRPQAELRALVVIANPADLEDYRPNGQVLAPINVAGESARAATGLGQMRHELLVSNANSPGAVSLNAVLDRLRDGYDIFYLVCHGALIKEEPRLYLEDEAGHVAVVSGSDLALRISELLERPRLVVLASCQSAGPGTETFGQERDGLTALGPQLAEAGVPAVLAMQGNISMQTVEQFMPRFFQELQRDGHIDRAMAVARGSVRERPDSWVPVLFMRLKSGRIWYAPGFAGDGREFGKWPALLQSIRQGHCTPILGAGLTEPLLGSSREIAQRWADAYRFPLAPYQREDLPQVAQYLAIDQGYSFLRAELEEYLRQEVMRRYGNKLPEEAKNAAWDHLLETAWKEQQSGNPAEAHCVLASLPFPIYITTNSDTLLEKALTNAGKAPRVELCRWNRDIEWIPDLDKPDLDKAEPDQRPHKDKPLVYHLFGRNQDANSLVLTEDDYFDYLIGVTSNKDLIPRIVRGALSNTALLFLGFQLDDWNFRVFFRSIMSQEGQRRRERHPHVAVQIDPEEGRIQDPERARRYLETYFEDVDISIYWGSVHDFMADLKRKWSPG